MPEKKTDKSNENGNPWMDPLQSRHNAFTVLVAKLILGNYGNEYEAYEKSYRHRPHQRITIVASRHGRIDQVPGAQPGQGHNDSRTNGSDVLAERFWYLNFRFCHN